MNSTSKWLAIVAVAFVAGSFVASPELRAYASTIANDVICTGCVGTSDIAGNAVTATKIKDGEVKAAEIATDAVGAAELQGVTKLLFGRCVLTSAEAALDIPPNTLLGVDCTINGVATGDTAVVTYNQAPNCFGATQAFVGTDKVTVFLRNDCSTTEKAGASSIGVIVFKK